MLIQRSVEIVAPTDEVWRILASPRAAAELIPGLSLVEVREDGSLEAELELALGPTSAVFTGVGQVVYEPGGYAGTLQAQGADARKRTRVAGELRFGLVPRPGAGCTLSTSLELTVRGPLAHFAESGGTHLASRVLDEFGANVVAAASGDDDRQDPLGPLRVSVAGSAVATLRSLGASLRRWWRRRSR